MFAPETEFSDDFLSLDLVEDEWRFICYFVNGYIKVEWFWVWCLLGHADLLRWEVLGFWFCGFLWF